MHPFTLQLNSSDGYDDCWAPFFTLMKAYWPEYTGTIVLNTESKEYHTPGLAIVSAKAAAVTPGRRPTWSECFLHAMAQAPTDIILYAQEDYFLKSPVDHALITDLAETMKREKITYLGLTEFGQKGPFEPYTGDERLWEISQKDPYRISLQACMFDRRSFARYVRRHENPWQFEYYGNIRARRTKDNFATLNRNLYSLDAHPVFPYDATGVVNGKWKADVVVDLFAEHGILVDYKKRGWWQRGQGGQPKKPMSLGKAYSIVRSLI